jgi:hypothetical protein
MTGTDRSKFEYLIIFDLSVVVVFGNLWEQRDYVHCGMKPMLI